jgi:hypothetical protein
LTSNGLPCEKIAGAIADVLPLLKVVDKLPSATTLRKEDGAQDIDVKSLRVYLGDLLRDTQVTLYIDASDTKYCGKLKVTFVIADAPTLPHPVLLEVKLESGEVSCDAQYHVNLIQAVIEQYGLDPAKIAGIATDNTNVMPRFVRDAGFDHFPCVAHVINLMLTVIAKALGLKDLLGWREFFARSQPRCNAARTAKLNYMACQVPEHRFCYALPCLEELVENWDGFAALLQATIDEYTGTLSSNLEHLAENMFKPGVRELVRAKVLIARKLCEQAERLVKVTSCDIRSLPFSFSTWFHAWLDLLQISESDVEEFITATVGGTVALTAAQRAAVAQATPLAISDHGRGRSRICSRASLCKPPLGVLCVCVRSLACTSAASASRLRLRPCRMTPRQ